MIDTGTSLAAIPSDVFEDLKREWRRSLPNVDCSQSICYVEAACSDIQDSLQDISIGIGNKNFIMSPKGYLLNAADIAPALGNACIFAF